VRPLREAKKKVEAELPSKKFPKTVRMRRAISAFVIGSF
jgi:hypothetical protein